MVEIILPWPPKELNPNKRLHWARKSKIAKQYRFDCFILTYAASQKLETINIDNLAITFHPPDKRHRDDDNIIGSFKNGRDGISDAWNINDKHFKPKYQFGKPVKGGRVVVKI